MLKVCKYEVQNEKKTKKTLSLTNPSSDSVANFLLQVKNSNDFISTSQA